MSQNGQGTRESGPVEDRTRNALAEPLLDASAAARLVSVRPSWIYEAVRAGRIPRLKIGRHIRFLWSDLEDWVVTRRVQETAASRIRPRT